MSVICYINCLGFFVSFYYLFCYAVIDRWFVLIHTKFFFKVPALFPDSFLGRLPRFYNPSGASGYEKM